MNSKKIIEKSKEIYQDSAHSEAFVRGAEWLADYLCKIPFDKIIQELHSYVKEKSDRREAHDEHK